jgi:molybdopterin/thiamine biosynthesis adenylyltransferase
MIIWFLTDPARAGAEQQRVAVLEDQAWLVDGHWLLRGSHLCYDADIMIGDTAYPITLRYPATFPVTPPFVLPRGEHSRWSEHQYGAGGELCLEHGADNWHSNLTGADLLLSARRLLSAEHGGDDNLRREVLSRHKVTEGQRLRFRWLRWVQTAPLLEMLAVAKEGGDLSVRLVFAENTVVATVSKITGHDGTEWSDPSVPDVRKPTQWLLSKGFLLPGTGLKISDWDSLLAAITAAGLDANRLLTGEVDVVVTVDEAGPIMLWAWHKDKSVCPFEAVPPQAGDARRLPSQYEQLSHCRVAIVGAGSLGSKVAASLARSGILDFLLVDDDIFRPENVVRHDLDWRSVGDHKVDAVAHRIVNIAPGTNCDLRRARLTGQESSGYIDAVIRALCEADIVIDASACPEVFNLLTMVVKTSGKRLVWGEIFAGGIGGLIARHRPGIDPDPQAMRLALLRWCENQDVQPPPIPTAPYEAAGETVPLVADDADVSVIGGHMTQLVTDLIVKEKSDFPYSMYLIGMKPGWIFTQPFEAIPLDTGITGNAPVQPVDADAQDRGVQFVLDLLKGAADAADNTG